MTTSEDKAAIPYTENRSTLKRDYEYKRLGQSLCWLLSIY